MTITYINRLESLTAVNLRGFFAGWPAHPDPQTHLEILRRSHIVWLAFDHDRCVGFVNALSDGAFCASIPLLEVLPGYQGRGIGKELMTRMLESLSDMYAIDVVCDEAVAPFYDKLGFSRCVGMVKRDYGNQNVANPCHLTPASTEQPGAGR
ncbi:MAG: GNAT family N-acetyltransferase [Dehalococcoidia bacterium]